MKKLLILTVVLALVSTLALFSCTPPRQTVCTTGGGENGSVIDEVKDGNTDGGNTDGGGSTVVTPIPMTAAEWNAAIDSTLAEFAKTKADANYKRTESQIYKYRVGDETMTYVRIDTVEGNKGKFEYSYPSDGEEGVNYEEVTEGGKCFQYRYDTLAEKWYKQAGWYDNPELAAIITDGFCFDISELKGRLDWFDFADGAYTLKDERLEELFTALGLDDDLPPYYDALTYFSLKFSGGKITELSAGLSMVWEEEGGSVTVDLTCRVTAVYGGQHFTLPEAEEINLWGGPREASVY